MANSVDRILFASVMDPVPGQKMDLCLFCCDDGAVRLDSGNTRNRFGSEIRDMGQGDLPGDRYRVELPAGYFPARHDQGGVAESIRC